MASKAEGNYKENRKDASRGGCEEERKVDEYREIGTRLRSYPDEELRKAKKLVSSFLLSAEEIEEEEVREKALNLTQAALNDDAQEIDMNQLFMDTTVKKKGRALGVGDIAQTHPLHIDSSASYVKFSEIRCNNGSKR